MMQRHIAVTNTCELVQNVEVVSVEYFVITKLAGSTLNPLVKSVVGPGCMIDGQNRIRSPRHKHCRLTRRFPVALISSMPSAIAEANVASAPVKASPVMASRPKAKLCKHNKASKP